MHIWELQLSPRKNKNYNDYQKREVHKFGLSPKQIFKVSWRLEAISMDLWRRVKSYKEREEVDFKRFVKSEAIK